MPRMIHVADLRRDHFGPRGVGEEEELIELVRRDVADDAAEILPVPEPRRARLRIDAMRAEADSLDDFADSAGFDQLAGFDGGGILESLAVHNRIDALRLPLYVSGLGQLRERGGAWLVDHEVLAAPHHANAERRAIIRDRGADDQVN